MVKTMEKRGRKPTGLTRKNVVQVALNDEENEYVARNCYEEGMSGATYGRKRMLPMNWRSRLELLRKLQNYSPLNQLDGRRREE